MNAIKHTPEHFIHIVLFWLKSPADFNDRNVFEQNMKKFLETSQYAKNKHFGAPAKTNRPVVDSSYTYCLKVMFENLEDHDNYQAETPHKLFISESSRLWEKVLIYDSEVF